MKLIRLLTISNLFALEVVQSCQHCQLCVLRENSNGICVLDTQSECLTSLATGNRTSVTCTFLLLCITWAILKQYAVILTIHTQYVMILTIHIKYVIILTIHTKYVIILIIHTKYVIILTIQTQYIMILTILTQFFDTYHSHTVCYDSLCTFNRYSLFSQSML